MVVWLDAGRMKEVGEWEPVSADLCRGPTGQVVQ